MRYSQIRSMDISNGFGIGISLFIQGCPIHCKNCFNPETWDFNGGKLWTNEIEKKFLNLVDKPYIKRVSILGGEPLVDDNIQTLIKLVSQFDQKLWIYTGYTYENLNNNQKSLVELTDVLVDGPYIHELRDVTLLYRGSKNQRVIDVQQTIKEGKIVLWE